MNTNTTSARQRSSPRHPKSATPGVLSPELTKPAKCGAKSSAKKSEPKKALVEEPIHKARSPKGSTDKMKGKPKGGGKNRATA